MSAEPLRSTADAPPGAARPPEVTVVLPCLDERDGVGGCVRAALAAFAAAGIDGEVVVVDNGSRDGSPELAAAAGARVVHEARRGYGSAYLRGFAEARGRIVVMADADGSYDLGDLPRFVAELERSGADLVMGNRFAGRILPGAMPWLHRWVGNPVLSAVLRLFFHTRVGDSHCGMRAVRRESLVALDLRTTGMELASEMVVRAARAGMRVTEVPITYAPRAGASKLRTMRDGWRHLRFMLLFAPSFLFLLPGVALGGVGLALVAALAAGPATFLGRTWDYHALVAGAILLLLGFNLVAFDLLAKTYSMAAGLAPAERWLRRFHARFRLERGLVAGGAVALAGALAEATVVARWLASGGGPLAAIRPTILGLVLLTLGTQVVFTSFLLALLRLERR